MKEIEVKILEINPEKIRETLRKNKAKFIKKVFQRNVYFENDYTKKNKVFVRLRQENKNYWITIKHSPQIINGHKIRKEHETKINDIDFFEEAFKLVGLKEMGVGEAIREYYKLNGCSIEIIKMPAIPYFLEVEGSENGIKKTAELLGYSTKDYSPISVLDVYKTKSKFLRFKK